MRHREQEAQIRRKGILRMIDKGISQGDSYETDLEMSQNKKKQNKALKDNWCDLPCEKLVFTDKFLEDV